MSSRRLPARLNTPLVAGVTIAALLATPLLAVTGAGASPSPAPAAAASPPAPKTAAEVTARLDELAHTAERLAEQYNATVIEVAAADAAAQAAQAALAKASAGQQSAQRDLAVAVVAEYENPGMSRATALLVSADSQSYVDKLSTLNELQVHRSAVVGQLIESQVKLRAAQDTADKALVAATAKRDAVAAHRRQVIERTAEYTRLRATLTARELAAYRARQQASADAIASVATAAPSGARQASAGPASNVITTKSAPRVLTTTVRIGSSAAQTAVNFALAQVGKPYVYAADGPGSYDCSGLTMASWRAAGVSIPHQSSQQYNYGTHVSQGDLRPGDLVFFYHPISHVAIYIGNGMIVSAPQPGENVEIVALSHFQRDYVGATRLA